MKTTPEQLIRYADMFAAMGTESRLRIMQLLLSAHPDGMVVGEIQDELDISASNLSHHLEKLKKRGPGSGQPGRNFPAMHGQYGGAPGIADLLVRRMLHPEQSR